MKLSLYHRKLEKQQKDKPKENMNRQLATIKVRKVIRKKQRQTIRKKINASKV